MMKNFKLLLTVFVVIILTFGLPFLSTEILKQPAWAASISWDGGGDAVSWSDSLNWSTDTVPTAVDDVLIDADVTVNLASGTTVNSLVLGNTSGTTLPVLNFTYDSVGTTAPLIVDSGNLEIYSGGKITHSAGTSVVVGSVNIDIQTGDLIVHSGGSIDVSEKGHARDQGVGNPTSGRGGAGYGGIGGESDSGSAGGVSYGSMVNPLDIGSGGVSSAQGEGGKGGGLVKLNIANSLNLNGGILANGGNGTSLSVYTSSGGSGGSINITIGNVWGGTGSISSNGGNGTCQSYGAGGGGAGGRIAINGYSSKTYSGSISVVGGLRGIYFTAAQGTDGGAGTIYLKEAGALAELIVGGLSPTDSQLGGITPISYNQNWRSIEISDYSLVDFELNVVTGDLIVSSNAYVVLTNELSATNIEISDSAYVSFSNNTTASNITISTDAEVVFNSSINISNTLDLNSSRLSLNSTSVVSYSIFNFVNSDLVDKGGIFPHMQASNLLIPAGCTIYSEVPRTYTNGVIEGTFTHSSNTNTLINKIDYTFTGNLTITPTGEININEKGYSGGNGIGAGEYGPNKSGAGGGGHGGSGGNGEDGILGGIANDTPNNPQDAGSGGGNSINVVGGTGGGLLILEVSGVLDVQGSILANGGNGKTYVGGTSITSSGGGAGGSINIHTNSFTGNGNIEARGGNAFNNYGYAHGGGGGGGLISIIYEESTFTGTAVATGGTGANNGEDGVVNVAASNQPPEALHSNISTPQNLYAGFSYSIDAIYSDPDGQDDISELYLKLQNPAGDDIELKATGSATDLIDQIPEVLTGSSHIDTPKYSIYPTYGTANEIKVTWTFDIGWNWIETVNLNYAVKVVDSAATSSSYSSTTEGFDYKKTLEFNPTGNLLVTNESGDPISSGSWLLPNSTVSWTGYKVVYQGETNIYPNPEDYNIKLEDSTGRFWLDSGTEGVDFSLTTQTLLETTVENIYTLSITDLPLGGISTDSKNFTIKVDADEPTILSLLSTTHSNEETWYSENEVEIQWEVEDNHGGIGEMYVYISNNPDESASIVENNGILKSTTEHTTEPLEDGINYIYLLVKDTVGSYTLENISVRIDTSFPDILEVKGPYKDVWQNIDSGPPLTWNNPLSISGDTFYITTNGSLPTKSNFRYATNQTQYNIEQLGDGVHTINVRACNGANTCGAVRSFTIKYDSKPTSIVKNISTSLSSSNRVTLNWSNPTESDFNKVVVVRKVGSSSSTVNDGTKVYEGSNRSFTDRVLSSSTTYYYTIWAYDHVGNISQRNSASVTTLDLIPPAPVTNFKIAQQSSNILRITWVNPEDTDFSGVLLYRNDALIYEGEDEEYIDTLSEEGKYEYKIVAYDSSENISKEEIINYDFVSSSDDVTLIREDSKSEKVVEGRKSKVKKGENVEIKISVRKLMGDVELEDTDRLVLSISDVEYDLVLSEDRTYFSTRFIAPDRMGDHNISIRALRDDSVLAEMELDIEVVDDDDESSSYENSNEQEEDSSSYIYWIIGSVLLVLTLSSVAFISKRKNKEA